MTISTVCRQCGTEIEADRTRILAGDWRTCDECAARRRHAERDSTAGQCQRCGRHLKDPRRFICLSCAGISTA